MNEITPNLPPAADRQSDAIIASGGDRQSEAILASTNGLPMPPLDATVSPMRSVERRLLLWPGVVIVLLLWLVSKVPSWIMPMTMVHYYSMFFTPMVAAAAAVCWWLFFSRLRWTDRLLGAGAFLAFGVGAFFLATPNVRFVMFIYALPLAVTVWVAWLVVSFFLSWPVRRLGLLVVLLLTWGAFDLLNVDGIDGQMGVQWRLRWAPSAEDRFLAELDTKVKDTDSTEKVVLGPGDWAAFRGPQRDGVLHNVKIATDWNENKPELLWKHRVGPGWSSFAVVGDRIYSQEQWGKDEAVVCYDADSGEKRWFHKDETRFTETMAGPGPRATPTFHDGMIYALGANGHLNCLDAASGKLQWTRDIASDADAKVPMWGFSSSPLIVQGIVTVFAGGKDGKSVLGYDAKTGKPAWESGTGTLSYCSTQLAKIDGVDQLLVTSDVGLTSFDPVKGDVLWKHEWDAQGGNRVVQPTVVEESDVLIGTSFGVGVRRVHVGRSNGDWLSEEVWTNDGIHPSYNDLVVRDGCLYGFDNDWFICVNLENGKRKWRTKGYGNGQVLLLADQGVLLVLSETGEVALVEAKPDKYKELCRFQAIEGKTWNHPVIAHGKLFVRNGEEMACYRLKELK
jgi:outer membrane protein assembly factor BamB